MELVFPAEVCHDESLTNFLTSLKDQIYYIFPWKPKQIKTNTLEGKIGGMHLIIVKIAQYF